MKKITLIASLLILGFLSVNAQKIGTLWGLTSNGGDSTNGGVLFNYNANTNTENVIRSFPNGPYSPQYGNLIQGSDGNLYGMAELGGNGNGDGAIFKTDLTGKMTILYAFNGGADGGYPYGSLVQASDGNLYGMTHIGGNNGDGVVFKCSTSGAYSVIYSFSNSETPYGSLIQGTDGNLYGMTFGGGVSGLGTIFQCSTSGTLNTLVSFTGQVGAAPGASPYGRLVQALDGNLYGMTSSGGKKDSGVIFKCSTTGIYDTLLSLTGNNAQPFGSLIQATDGNLYGMTFNGGPSNIGTVFQCTTTGILTTIMSFTNQSGAVGSLPYGDLVQASDGNLWGMTEQGGAYGYGAIFNCPLAGAPEGESYSLDFTQYPYGSLVQATDGNLYGMTSAGGSANDGTIFQMTLSGTYNAINNLGTFDVGSHPNGGLIKYTDGAFYGLTANGGSHGIGTLFKYYNGITTVVHNFNDSNIAGYTDGSTPYGSLIKARNGMLYGVTESGGNGGAGMMFSYDPKGNAYNIVASFGGDYGNNPYGSLIQGSDDRFYVMLETGGAGYGEILSVDSNGSTNVEHTFEGNDGSNPYGTLIQSANGVFYGMTSHGGANAGGVIFSDSIGNYTVLHNFTSGTDGEQPFGNLILAKDGYLYGMTYGGGPSGYGTIFKCSISGASYTTIYDFGNGERPEGTLIQASDGNLYGMCFEGGQDGEGYIFKCTTSGTLTDIFDFSQTDGANPVYGALLEEFDVKIASKPNCSNNGTTTLSVSETGSGVAPYTYSWSNGSTASSINVATNALYSVTVTDSKGIPATDTLTVPAYSPITLTGYINQPSCSYSSDGLAGVTLTGGLAPFTYSWNGGQTTTTISSIAAGTYTVTVTDSAGCQATNSVQVIAPAAIRDSIVSQTNISCYGGFNGSATIGVKGGTGGYNYTWDDPSNQNTPTAVSLYGGSYTCAVTDANGCTPPNNPAPAANITQPQQLGATTGGSNTICSGNEASLVVSVNGGTLPYNYNWTPGNLSGPNQQVLPTNTTSYSVSITDNNGCSLTTTQTVIVNTSPVITINSNVIGGTSLCEGNSDTLSAVVTGSGPFNYTWSEGGSTTDSIEVTTANTYSVFVHDANGCSNNAYVNINVSSLPVIVISGNTTICNGASTTLTALGAASSYSWIGGPTSASYSVSPTTTTTYTVTGIKNGCSNTATQTITVNTPGAITANAFPSTSVCAGNSVVLFGSGGSAYNWSGGVNNGQSFYPSGQVTYTVTSISNGCAAQDTITVGVNALPVVNITANPTSSVCQGGSVTLTATGGTSYTWTNGVTNGIAFSPATTDEYAVTVTDANGCENSGQIQVTVNSLPIISGSVTPQTVCQGSSVTLNGNGGTAYTWTGGVTNGVAFAPSISSSYTVTGTDAAGCNNTAIVGVTINPVPVIGDSAIPSTSVCQGNPVALIGKGASSYSWSGNVVDGISFVPTTSGTYTVTGYGANGCTATDSITIKVNNKVVLTPLADNTTCGLNNGEVKVTASSGKPPYSYSWSTTPVNTTDSIGSLSPGTYIITVSDIDNCSSYASIDIASSTAPILSISSSSSSCGNSSGTATVGVVGGTPPYKYNWSNGDTTSYANNLTIGTYIVTVSDLNKCSSFASAEISNVDGPAITANAVNNVNCNGQSTGSIVVSVSGGAPPYKFVWSDGETTQNIANLSAGPYQLTVTDGNNCSALGSFTINQPFALSSIKSIVKANCGVADGAAIVTVSGGTPPYNYFWSNGRTSDSILNVNAGSYLLTVIDHNGCSLDSTQVSISNVNGPIVSISVSGSASCNGGGVTLTAGVTAGTSPYNYVWSTGSTATSINHIPAGRYNINVIDHLGCIGVADTTIYEVPPPVAPICLVSVDSATQKNIVIWNKYQTTGIESYNIYRETTQAGVYQKIANVPFKNLSTYVDAFPNPQTRSWRYELSQVDSCGNESALSPDNKTMHLTVNKGINGINLIWDNYEGIVFYTYYVYRDTLGGTLKLIDSIPNNIFTYTDSKPPLSLDSLYYVIQVVNPDPCLPSFNLISKPKGALAVNYNTSKSNTGNYVYNNAVGIPTVSSETGKLTVYPNPSTGVFTFTLTESKGSKEMKLTVVNELGQVIMTNVYSDVSATFTKQLDLSSLAKGVYFLKVQSDSDTHNSKIVLQ